MRADPLSHAQSLDIGTDIAHRYCQRHQDPTSAEANGHFVYALQHSLQNLHIRLAYC